MAILQDTRNHNNSNTWKHVWTEKCQSDTPVGIKSKRVFKEEIRSQSCALLLLDFMYAENDKNRNAQSMLCKLGVFFMPENVKNMTISLDGKKICSTHGMVG